MESEEIVRAFMLEPGDIFKLGSTTFTVRYIADGRIYYRYTKSNNGGKNGPMLAMGANSRERIILITNKTKNNEHQNRSNHFRKS